MKIDYINIIYKIITMAYYNRKDQIIQSLEQINNLYYNKYNFEVIIINNSNYYIVILISLYFFKNSRIKLILLT